MNPSKNAIWPLGKKSMMALSVVMGVYAVPAIAATAETSRVYFDYDEAGRLIARRGNGGQLISYTYDANDNVASVTDGGNHTTLLGYDSLNRLETSTDAKSGITRYEYDGLDQIKRVTDPRGNATSYVYDGLGQLWSQTSPDTGLTTFLYNTSGQRTSSTRNDGSTLSYQYDALGRLTRYGDSAASRSFGYDWCGNGKGRLCNADYRGGTKHFAYTPEGLISTTHDWTPASSDYTGFSYDGLGRLTGVSYPSGVSVGYGYTGGNLTTVTATIAGNTTTIASGIKYEPFGGVRAWTYGNGLTRRYSHDLDGRTFALSTGTASSVLQSLTYGFDADDRITAVTNGVNAGLSQSFQYDALERMTQQSYGAGGAQTRTYDGNGNLIRMIGPWDESLAIQAGSNRVTSMGTHVYAYDARGNRASHSLPAPWSSTATYGYDGFNRMTQYSRNVSASFAEPNGPTGESVAYPAGTWVYGYNAMDQRVSKAGPTGSVRYLYGGQNQLLAESGPSGWKSYIWLGSELLGVVTPKNSVAYVHGDHLGRPEIATDGNQSVVWRASNYAFGRTVTLDNIGGLNIGFPGQYYDGESGLWHNGFRDYDSRLGMYTQPDPIGLAGGLNGYAYVSGNPISLVDALGLESWQYSNGKTPMDTPWQERPDYIQASISLYVFSASVTMSRSGNVYGGIAISAQYPVSERFGLGASVNAGHLDKRCSTLAEQAAAADKQVDGFSQSVTAHPFIFGGGYEYSPGSGGATLYGFGAGYEVSPGSVSRAIVSTPLGW